MVNWDAKDIKNFKEEARTLQQEYCDLLGDRQWDVIECWSWTILRRKVGFGIYGLPNSTPTKDNLNTGYTSEQLKVIEKICDQLVENLCFSNSDIHFACIFVVVKVHEKRYTVPIFKAKRSTDSSSKCVFVDTNARKYSNWDDYLKNNTLEKCIYCYPTYGLYERNDSDNVCVSFGTSPACDFTARVFSVFDTVSTITTIAATGVGVVALCGIPVAGPVLSASAVVSISTSVYGVGRSANALYDRSTHNQTIGLNDAEARGLWISIAGSFLNFAQGRMVTTMTKAARAGEVMNKAGRIVFLVVQAGNLTVNGIGIVHSLANLIEKHERNELTPLDVFQFSASLLFFTNAVVKMKTASTIIKEVQHDVINTHREGLSKDAKKLFNKQTGKLRGRDEMHGNAKVVKQLNRIENSKDLFEMMVNKNVDNHKVKLTPDGFKGLLNVNENLKIHPLKLLEVPPTSRQAIFELTKKYANNDIDKAQFNKEVKTYCKQHRIVFESTRVETVKRICQIFGKENLRDIVVNGKKIFANATPHEIDRLLVVIENTAQNNETILTMATEFAKSRNCTTAKDLIIYTEYFVAELNETVRSYEESYQKDFAAAKKQPGFNQSKFDEARGIRRGIKRVQFHKEKALNDLKSENYNKLNERYESYKSKVGPLNQKCEPSFFSDDAATYHYVKHRHFGRMGELTPEEYFEVVEDVFGKPTNITNSTLSQDGSCVMITYLEPERGVRAIKIDRQEQSVVATVMYDDKVLKRD